MNRDVRRRPQGVVVRRQRQSRPGRWPPPHPDRLGPPLRLDPEAYLRDFFRVLTYWPSDRPLDLFPRDWRKTRARIDVTELERELGVLTVPSAPAEQSASR